MISSPYSSWEILEIFTKIFGQLSGISMVPFTLKFLRWGDSMCAILT